MSLLEAYRTVPAAALPVMAAVLPADLRIYKAKLRHELRREGRVVLGNRTVDEDEVEVLGMDGARMAIDEYVVAIWQRKWNSCSLGRRVWEVLRWVSVKRRPDWSPGTAQLVTGHGPCNSYLKRFKFVRSDRCECGAVDTLEHRVFQCVLADHLRYPVMARLR